MVRVRQLLSICGLTVAFAAAAQAEPKVALNDIPAAVLEAVKKVRPTMTITEAEYKARDGREYYDVEGAMPNGDEIELDMLKKDGAWTVVEIQRDIPWATAPMAVRAEVAKSPKSIEPVRVIESVQATDGTVIFELFAAGKPAKPSLEVMLKDRAVTVLTEEWPH